MAAWMMTFRPANRGRVIGLGVGRFAWVGAGVGLALTAAAFAGPEGAKVAHGSATLTRQGDTTVIQAADRTVINYSSFNIASHETVQFIQPNASSRVLNRIQGADPSRIDGSLLANGRVYIVNPAGVYFGSGALVNVGGIYAAAANITDADFLGGRDKFSGASGSVINEGTIQGDFVALVGRHVSNTGLISAEKGLVAMAAGEDIFISELGGRIMARFAGANAPASSETPGVSNTGTVRARQASFAAGDMYSAALDMGGLIEARRIEARGGKDGVVAVTGTLDASTTEPGHKGGRVHVLGDRVGLGGATIDVSGPAGGGEVLIGGEYLGGAHAPRGSVSSAMAPVPNAERTFVDSHSRINANATEHGDGGKVIVWADDWTMFHGTIEARGGERGGDGGFVEVSGKESLLFLGSVDTSAPMGKMGTLLLDPATLNIIDDISGAGDQDARLIGQLGAILAGDPDEPMNTVSWGAIVGLGAATNVVLQATGLITIEDVTGNAGPGITSNNLVELPLDTGSITITSTGGSIVFDDPADVIRTEGGAITLEAMGGSITGGGFNTTGATGTTSGNVTLTAAEDVSIGNILAGSGTVMVTADNDNNGMNNLTVGAITAGAITVSGGTDNDEIILVQGTLTSSGALTVRRADELRLGMNVQLLANGGLLNVNTDVGSIVLTSAAGTNVLTSTGDVDTTMPTITGAGAGLSVNSQRSLTFGGSVSLTGGAFTATADSNNNTLLALLNVGAVTAGAITLQGGTTANDAINITGDVTGTSILIQRGISTDLAQNVDLTATGGLLTVSTSSLNLSGAAGTNMLISQGGLAISLPQITTTGAANLTINSQGSVALNGSVAVGAGALSITADSDNNTVGATLNATSTLNGTGITLSGGTDGNDRIILNANVTSLAGLTIQNADEVEVAAGRTLTGAGNVNIHNGVGEIVLVGAGGTNTISATGGGNLQIGDARSTNNAALTLSAHGNVTFDTINTGSGAFSATADSDNNTVLAILTAGRIDAGAVTLQGGTTPNDLINLTGDVTGTSILIDRAVSADLAQDVGLFTTNGALTVTVLNLNISGAGGTNQILGMGGAVSLPQITTSGTANLTLASEGDLSVSSSLNIGTGALSASVDTDNNSASTLLMNGTVTAASILFQGGTDGNDVFDLRGNVTSAAGITAQNAAELRVALNVNLTAAGNISASLAGDNLAGITLTGAGGTNTFTANSEGDIRLAPITSSSNAALVVSAQRNVNLEGVNTGTGLVTVTADSNNNSLLADLTTGPITGGAITLRGGTTVNDTINIIGNIVGSSVLIERGIVADLAQDVGITANAGAVTITTLEVNLSGAAGLNTITSIGGGISLPQISRNVGGLAGLTVASQAGVTVSGPINIGGDLAMGVDTDNTGSETLRTMGTVNAANITFTGTGGNDTFDLDANVNASGNLLLQNAMLADVGGSLNATGTLTIIDVDTVDLALNRNMSAGGDLFAFSGVSQIRLVGNGGTNTFAASNGGGISLAPVTSTMNASLTLSSHGDIDLQAINLGGGVLTATVDDGAGTPGATMSTLGITADTIGLFGGTDLDDILIVGGPINATGNGLLVSQFGSATLGDIISAAGINITANTISLNGPLSAMGNVSIAGATTLAADITSGGGSIIFGGPLTLASNVLMDSAGGSITFGDVVNADAAGNFRALGLTAGAGNIDMQGAVGGTQRLGDVTFTSAANITTNAISARNITQIAGTGTTTFGGALNTNGNADITLTGNAFTVNGPVTTANGAGFIVTNAGVFNTGPGGDMNLAGAFTQNGPGLNIIAGDITTAGGAITFGTGITLAGSSSFATTGGGAPGANISLGGAINGTTAGLQNFLLDAGTGNISFGSTTGAATRLGLIGVTNAGAVSFGGAVRSVGLVVNAGTITVGAINTSGAPGVELTGTDITLSGAITTTGGGGVTLTNSGQANVGVGGPAFILAGPFTQNGTGPVSLGAAITTPGAISFASPVTLTRSVTLAGNGVTFGGALGSMLANIDLTVNPSGGGITTFGGAVSGLRNLTVANNGPTHLGAGLAATGGISLTGPVVLLANSTITANTVNFGGTIDGDAAGRNLTVNTINSGTTTFGGAIGSTTPLGSIMTNADGTTVLAGASIATSGAQTWSDPITLANNVIMSGSDVTFAQTVNSDSNASPRALTVNSGGATVFGGAIGNTSALTMLTTNAGGSTAFAGPTVRTTMSQTYNDAVTLTGDVQFTATNPNGTIFFGDAVDGPGGMTVNAGGDTTFTGPIGASAILASLTTDPAGRTLLNSGTVRTTGAQTFGDAVILGADSAFTAGALTFGGTLNSNGTARSLTAAVGGVTRFSGAVGAVSPLSAIFTNAAGTTVLAGGSFNTTGTQTYNDAVTLAANTSVSAGSLTFGSTLNSDGTPRALAVNLSGAGGLNFSASVGAGSPLASLSVQGGSTRFSASLTSTGAQTYGSPVLLLQSVSLTGSDITFASTVDSLGIFRSLTVTPGSGGTVRFAGPIGATGAINGLTVDGGTTIFEGLAGVTTAGSQSYTSDVLIEPPGNVFVFDGVNITIEGSLNAPTGTSVDVVFNTNSSGTTRFVGAIGDVQPVNSLTTNEDGVTELGADITADGGTITFNNRVVVVDNSTLLDRGATGIIFASLLDGDGSNSALTLRLIERAFNVSNPLGTSPRIIFGDHVGSVTPLGSLAVGIDNRAQPGQIGTIISGLGTNGMPIPNHSLIIATSGDFIMTPGEKLVVLGDLTINAGGRAVLSDLTALGSITVNSPTIEVNVRQGATLAENVFGSLIVTPAGADSNTDFVAGQSITFSSSPSIPTGVGGMVRAATRTGDNMNLNDNGRILLQAFTDFGLSSLLLGGVVLDVRAQGPSPTNVAEAIAGAILVDTEAGRVDPPGVIGRSAGLELRQLGVNVREMPLDLLMETLVGRALFIDLPGTPREGPADYKVTMNRLPADLAMRVLDRARNLFSPGGPGDDATPRIQDAIAVAWDEYQAAAGAAADGRGFRAFLAESAEFTEADGYVREVGLLLHDLWLLGLTHVEYDLVVGAVVARIHPSDSLSMEALREAVLAPVGPAPEAVGVGATETD